MTGAEIISGTSRYLCADNFRSSKGLRDKNRFGASKGCGEKLDSEKGSLVSRKDEHLKEEDRLRGGKPLTCKGGRHKSGNERMAKREKTLGRSRKTKAC